MNDRPDGITAERGVFPRPGDALALIAAVALATRLLALPGSSAGNMDPDSARLLNVARYFERG